MPYWIHAIKPFEGAYDCQASFFSCGNANSTWKCTLKVWRPKVLQIPPESLLPVYSSSSHHQWPLSLHRGTGSRKRGSLSFSYCRFCDYKSSKGPSSVRRHVRFRHTGEKPFACLHCGKKFCEKTDLHTHLRIHTGEKPYQCRTCFKKFRVLNGLKSHYKTNVMCDPVNRYYSTPSET